MTQQMLEVQEGFVVEFQNKDTCLGCYYAEDDWSIVGVGKTLQEAVEDAIPEALSRGLNPSSAYASKCRFVTFEGRNISLDGPDGDGKVVSDGHTLRAMLTESPKYAATKTEELKKRELAEAEAKKKRDAYTTQQEINQLKALAGKYPDALKS
jgi:hypothetical protein